LPGDGIGPEVLDAAVDVLKSVAEHYQHEFEFEYGLIGGAAIDEAGAPLPEETVAACKAADAILLGAVGGPKWDQNPSELRPEKGLLAIRKQLDLFANLRPVKVFESLAGASPLKAEYIEGVDFVIVRELTGGLYFGKPSEQYVNQNGEEEAVDTLFYKKSEMERVIREAFQMAQRRKGKVTSVDKANVLESSKLWRKTAEEVAKEFPDVKLEHMLVDNAAMQLIYSGLHLYEPVHGSAPDIAGQNIANPLAAILSAAMMLRTSFGLEAEAKAVEHAVDQVLRAGKRTKDLAKGSEHSTTQSITGEVKAALADDNAISNIMTAYV